MNARFLKTLPLSCDCQVQESLPGAAVWHHVNHTLEKALHTAGVSSNVDLFSELLEILRSIPLNNASADIWWTTLSFFIGSFGKVEFYQRQLPAFLSAGGLAFTL